MLRSFLSLVERGLKRLKLLAFYARAGQCHCPSCPERNRVLPFSIVQGDPGPSPPPASVPHISSLPPPQIRQSPPCLDACSDLRNGWNQGRSVCLRALPKVFEVGLYGCLSRVFITPSACTLLIPKFILQSGSTAPVHCRE